MIDTDRRDLFRLGGAAGLMLLASETRAAPAPEVRVAPLGEGDLAIVNARIITLDPQRPDAQAALVRRGRIVMVGGNRDVLAAGRDCPQFDAGGKAMIPGFVDNHCHLEDSCIVADQQMQLQGATSIAEIVDRLRGIAAKTPKGEWIIVQAPRGLFPEKAAERRWIARTDLDQATQAHPVMMLFGIHFSAMNSPAFRQTGYWDSDMPATAVWSDGSPRRGSIVQRDGQGMPTGIITEIWDYRPGYSVDQYKAAITAHVGAWFLAKGLTSITTLQNESPAQFQALQILQAEGRLPVRLRVAPIVPHAVPLSDVTRLGWRTGFGSDMLRFGGVKFFLDGIHSDGQGHVADDIKWRREDLIRTLTDCQRGGLQTILHAVSDEAVLLALDCIEAAQKAAPGELRHRIDHQSPKTDALIQRFADLGVVSGITGRQQAIGDRSSSAASARLHRFRTLYEKRAGILVLDAAGPGGNYHPMRGIANAMATDAEGGSALPGEALTFEQALRLWTIEPARNSFEDDRKGSIEAGKFGDFAVLSADPRGRPPQEIFAIDTVATIVGGQLVHGG